MAEELDLTTTGAQRQPVVTPPLIDRATWQAVRAGDNAARERFYRCYAEAVFRAIRGWSHSLSVEESEDLLSETFLRIFRHVGEQLDFARLEGWIFGIARNTVTDHWRKRGRALRELTSDDFNATSRSQLRAASDGVLGELIKGEDRTLLTALIDSILAELPVRQQSVLLAKYKQNKSQAEIGAAMGLNEDAVASLLYRARAAFRERFEQRMREER